jgi:5-methylcytosine-specific restriction endonuclease McrA
MEAMMSQGVLDLPTLVLNRQWQLVHVTTVARSLILLWNDAARVVDPDEYQLFSWSDWALRRTPDGEPCIRSARLRLPVPEIITLAHYDRLPNTAVTFSRRNVAKRDHYTCQYCGAQPGAESITIDHVLPRSQGERRAGPTAWPPASGATPAKGTGLLTRPACGCAGGRSVPSGSRSTSRREPASKAGPDF